MVWPGNSRGKVSAPATGPISRRLTSAITVWQALDVGEELGSREVRSRTLCACVAIASLLACTPTALDTIALGDNPEARDLAIDETFFHCEIQPKVLTTSGCATGAAAESGSCHAARSALRLVVVPTTPICQGGYLVGAASPESIVNLERVRTSIGADADSSPLYRRPLGLDSHPRTIFVAADPPAQLLRDWLNRRGSP
jgi:hypothetical protein